MEVFFFETYEAMSHYQRKNVCFPVGILDVEHTMEHYQRVPEGLLNKMLERIKVKVLFFKYSCHALFSKSLA